MGFRDARQSQLMGTKNGPTFVMLTRAKSFI